MSKTRMRRIASPSMPGAASLEKPMDTPYGDRRATVLDSWGNTWQIATHRTV
jgi:uncharacterized glyoxalase superfamily protein PhnB